MKKALQSLKLYIMKQCQFKSLVYLLLCSLFFNTAAAQTAVPVVDEMFQKWELSEEGVEKEDPLNIEDYYKQDAKTTATTVNGGKSKVKQQVFAEEEVQSPQEKKVNTNDYSFGPVPQTLMNTTTNTNSNTNTEGTRTITVATVEDIYTVDLQNEYYGDTDLFKGYKMDKETTESGYSMVQKERTKPGSFLQKVVNVLEGGQEEEAYEYKQKSTTYPKYTSEKSTYTTSKSEPTSTYSKPKFERNAPKMEQKSRSRSEKQAKEPKPTQKTRNSR